MCFFSGNTASCVVFERGEPVFIGVLCVVFWILSNRIILSFWDSTHYDYFGFWDKPHRANFECVLFAFLVVVIIIHFVSFNVSYKNLGPEFESRLEHMSFFRIRA